MKAHIVTLPGDYIGPEIVAQAVKVLNAVAEKYGHTFCFDERRLGGASIDAFGVPLTDETLAACNAADAVLMGSVGGPKWDAVEPARRPEKGLLALRKGMQVFANLRPCTIHPQLSGACPLRPDIIAKPIDIMILRELTGDIYFGKRWRSEDRAAATDEMAYSVPEVERLARIGFEMAKKRRGRLCSVDKANVLECSRLWRETVERLSREYPEVEVSFMYVDNAAMQLILNPAQFDVMITGNLFGDILSDESAAIAGSLGMMPSASLGSTTRGLYEPIHGSAPDIAGRDIANPLGTILSGALLLRHSLGLEQEAAAIERAVSQVLDEGYRTGDIFCRRLHEGRLRTDGRPRRGTGIARAEPACPSAEVCKNINFLLTRAILCNFPFAKKSARPRGHALFLFFYTNSQLKCLTERIRFFVLTKPSEVRRTGGTLNGTRQSQSEKDGARIKPF